MIRLPIFAILYPAKWAIMLVVIVCAAVLLALDWATDKVDR